MRRDEAGIKREGDEGVGRMGRGGPPFLLGFACTGREGSCVSVSVSVRACLVQLQLLNITPGVESRVELWSCQNPAPQL